MSQSVSTFMSDMNLAKQFCFVLGKMWIDMTAFAYLRNQNDIPGPDKIWYLKTIFTIWRHIHCWKRVCFLGEEGKAEPFLVLLVWFCFNYNSSKVEADSLYLELICLWWFSFINRADDKYLVSFWLLVWNSVNLLLTSWQIWCLRCQGMIYNYDLKAEVCAENLGWKPQAKWYLGEYIPCVQLNLGEVWN